MANIGNNSVLYWAVSLSLGGAIAALVYLLVVPDLGLLLGNIVVYVATVRLSFAVPDMLYSAPTTETARQAGFGAGILAFVLVSTTAIVSVDDASRVGIATLVFGVGLSMWLYGVWFERYRQRTRQSDPA